MRKVFNFDLSEPLPLVFAKAQGKLRRRPIRLVFDTGAFMIQISTSVIEELRYSARDGIRPIPIYGQSGPIDEGYALQIEHLELFGKRFKKLNELNRAKSEKREPIPLQSEPLTIENMRKIVEEYDQRNSGS